MMQASNNGFVIVLVTVVVTLVAVGASMIMGNNHLQDTRAEPAAVVSGVVSD